MRDLKAASNVPTRLVVSIRIPLKYSMARRKTTIPLVKCSKSAVLLEYET